MKDRPELTRRPVTLELVSDPQGGPLPYDISVMRFENGGIQDLYWPVAYARTLAMRDALVRGMVSLLDDAERGGRAGAVELKVVSPFVMVECMALFQAQELFRNLRSLKRNATVWGGLRMWIPLSQGFESELPEYFQAWAEAHPRKSPWRIFHKIFKKIGGKQAKSEDSFVPDEYREGDDRDRPTPMCEPLEPPRIHSSSLSARLARESVITTRRDHFISCHAAQSGQKVFFVGHDQWFSSLRPDWARAAERAVEPGLAKDMLGVVEAAFAAGGGPLEDVTASYARRYFQTGAALAGAYLGQVRARPRLIPSRLWTGTGGNFWDRILRRAVHEKGGEVTCHVHAGGSEYVNFPVNNFFELFECDVFAVNGRRQAEAAPAHMEADLLFKGAKPKVVPVQVFRMRPGSTGYPAVAQGPKRIMFIGTMGYRGDRSSSLPTVPDIVKVDWEARFISRLTEAGHQILFKPHPEEWQVPPSFYFDQLGAKMVGGRFLEVAHMADVILFDAQDTSTFNEALMAGLPMVFVDYDRYVWEADAYDLLKERCAVVPARFAEDNSIQVDWDELLEAVDRAPSLAGHRGFVERYMVG